MSSGLRLEVVADEDWAVRVADVWTERLAARPGLRMCLPTGSTPVPVYREMARRVAAGEVSFAAAEVFLLDEWLGLPPRHPVRCDSMLRRDLLDHVDVDPARTHTFEVGRGGADEAVRIYEAARGDEPLDLVMLGLGRNGHLGMNEPGSPFDAPTRMVELAEETRVGARRYGDLDEPPTHGVTFGLGPIVDAAEVWLLVSGAAKAEILAATLEGPVGTELPATVLRTRPDTWLVADRTAAGGLAADTTTG